MITTMSRNQNNTSELTDVIGNIPYRMAFAGGWIDQPFLSRLNPTPPGSMVVVSLEPTVLFMELSGMGTSTRKVALNLWGNSLPDQEPAKLVRELYMAENHGKAGTIWFPRHGGHHLPGCESFGLRLSL